MQVERSMIFLMEGNKFLFFFFSKKKTEHTLTEISDQLK